MKYATVVVSVLIVVAVLIPGPDLPDVDIGGFDKLIHLGMFGAWAFAVRYDFDRTPFPYFGFLLAGILFSGVTEVLQLLVEGRTFDFYDMAADAVGLLAGFAISAPVLKWWRKRR